MGNGHNHYNFALRSSKPNAGVLTINDRAGDSLFDCNPGNGRLLSDEGRDTREMVVESNIRNNLTGVFMPGVEHELRTDLAASIACSLNERNQIYSSEVVWDMIQVNDSGLRGFRGCPSRASGMSGSRTG